MRKGRFTKGKPFKRLNFPPMLHYVGLGQVKKMFLAERCSIKIRELFFSFCNTMNKKKIIVKIEIEDERKAP